MNRIIVFGDIHGCAEEWRELVLKINPLPQDRLIAVGDLIGKGPDTRGTLDFAHSLPNLTCLTGNHELHFLKAWKSGKLEDLTKDYQKRVLQELGPDLDEYMQWIESWPFYLDLKECLIVHGGIRPGIPLEKQSLEDLTNLRNLEDGRPWHEAYQGKKPVIYGHWARQGLCIKENSIGLDSGCVYGKELSAVILPERKIVQVRARKTYQEVPGKKD